jgi:hypothetical protein
MVKDIGNRQLQLRQLIAQKAARMMAEEGISDYAFAKKKAGRQISIVDIDCLPTNAEIEEEIKLYHEIYHADDQPEALRLLRNDALVAMQMLEKFDPHLTGPVLDGTAGRYAETNIHLFTDSIKEVEMFLLNNQVHYETDEKSYRVSNDKKSFDKKGNDRKKVPVFTLEGPNGLIKLSVFEIDDKRLPTKHNANGGNATRANSAAVKALIQLTNDK